MGSGVDPACARDESELGATVAARSGRLVVHIGRCSAWQASPRSEPREVWVSRGLAFNDNCRRLLSLCSDRNHAGLTTAGLTTAGLTTAGLTTAGLLVFRLLRWGGPVVRNHPSSQGPLFAHVQSRHDQYRHVQSRHAQSRHAQSGKARALRGCVRRESVHGQSALQRPMPW
ncbi:MAG: hypothetical protein F2809_07785 [Actinobacteria bacterium]|nr:hypothetical protein [Actinomycetota bacterium]